MDFDELYKENYPQIKKVLLGYVKNREDADDLCQEVFLEVFKDLDSFRGDSSITTWITRIAINKANNFKRKKRLEVVALSTTGEDGESVIPATYVDISSPESILSGYETEEEIKKKLGNLPANQAEAYALKEFDKLTYKEIAEKENITVGAAKTRVHRARSHLLSAVTE